MKPVVWSASSLNAYLTCPLRWWFSYIAVMPDESSEERAAGVAIHDYAEQRLNGSTDVHPDGISGMTEVFDRDILPTFRKPVVIEQSFCIDINGIPYSGVVDSIDEQDHHVLRDLKSTKARPPAGRYRNNLIGYWLGAREEWGIECGSIQLDYIVRTKTPYYWPEVQPIPSEDEIDIFAATLERAAAGVARGEFPASGVGTWSCRACGHASRCGPYQRYREVNHDA